MGRAIVRLKKEANTVANIAQKLKSQEFWK
jgi:hypothetical protein